MITVRIIKSWDKPNLMRQTPKQSGVWEGIRFMEFDDACDFAIILNRVPSRITLKLSPTHVWHITQEPPVLETEHSRPVSPHFYRRFTPDVNQEGSQYIHTQTALPWHVNRTYDELKTIKPRAKKHSLSWITSNLTYLEGHRTRMEFMQRLQSAIEFDLWGRGFTPLSDKWDGLAPYQYSLAVENYSGPHYWTEKLADCFLAWTMPIYYGATNIETYFPAEALIRIDITKPDEAINIITDAINSDIYLKNQDAIAYARELILDKYQFFPFITDHINHFMEQTPEQPRCFITLAPFVQPVEKKPLLKVLLGFLRKVQSKLVSIFHV